MCVSILPHVTTSYSYTHTCVTVVMPIKELTLQKSVYAKHVHILNSPEWYKLKITSGKLPLKDIMQKVRLEVNLVQASGLMYLPCLICHLLSSGFKDM